MNKPFRFFGQRYFESYNTIEKVLPDGNVIRESVYTGQYYKQDITDDLWKKRRVIYPLVFGFSILSVLIYGTRDIPTLLHWYGVLSIMVPLFIQLFACRYFYHYSFSPREMVVYQYRQVRSLPVWTSFCVLCHVAILAVLLICLIQQIRMEVVICMLLHILSAAGMALINRLESKVTYTERDSSVHPSDCIYQS